MGKFIFFLFVLVVIGAAVYAIASQPASSLLFDFKKLSGIEFFPKGGLFTDIRPSVPEPSSLSDVLPKVTVSETSPPGSSLSGGAGERNIIPPKGFAIDQLSDMYGLVKISGVSKPSAYYRKGGQFTLSANLKEGQYANITGWYVKGNRGNPVIIPQAVGDYSGFMTSRRGDIVLKKNEYVVVYGAKSPIIENLRLNMCTGYLNNAYLFSPTLPKNCPRVERNEIVTFSGRCQTFLLSLSSCKEPPPAEKNSLSGPIDAGCGGLLDTFNFQGCYKKYKESQNFFSREWKVWIGEAMTFDEQHDRLLLFDNKGLLVDEYIY